MATDKDYRSMRQNLAAELTDNDAKEIAFASFTRRSQQSKITNPRELITELERTDQFSQNNTDPFLKVLKDGDHNKAAKVLESYVESRSTENETSLNGKASTSTKSRKRKAPQTPKKNKTKKKKKADKGDLEVTTKTLRDLSGQLPNDWQNVGRILKLADAELDIIKTDHIGQKEVAYQMLLKWKQKNGNCATNRVLGEALEDAGRRDLKDNILK